MSRLHDRVDRDCLGPLQDLLAQVPGGIGAIADLQERRRVVAERVAERNADRTLPARVVVTDHELHGPAEAPPVRLRSYRPRDRDDDLPGIYVIHGGGMVLGDLAFEHHLCAELSDLLDVVVVQVDYRLAPEHPAPAGLEDCYAGLLGLVAQADDLGLDPGRLALYGGSAGGGLALGCALLARDRGGPTLALQMLLYPMLDDRHVTPSSHEILDLGIWDRATSLEAWGWYLGGSAGTDAVSPYVAPARMVDLTGLSPTYLDVGELDLFRDEDLELVARLVRAGVPTEAHLFPGAYHASESFAPDAELSHRIVALRHAALQRALGR